ncbi:MAG: hypothetical protein PHP27_04005 [Bacteroidales bacterium]|nr:hypothetical protein [Bacteroidales bacterium]
MGTTLATKLKKILDNTTQEEFDQEWGQVLALGLKGPNVDDFMDFNNFNVYNFNVDNTICSESLILAA